MSERRRVGTTFLFLTAAFGLAVAVRPLPVDRLLSIYHLAHAAAALAALTRLARDPEEARRGSDLDHALRPHLARPLRPPELIRTERELVLGTASAGHLDRRLLPLLREAAAARLVARHGVELDRRPELARQLLGEDAWALLRPDRPATADRLGPGIEPARLRSVVDALERL